MPLVDPTDVLANVPRLPTMPTSLEPWDGTIDDVSGLSSIEAAEVDAMAIDLETARDWEFLDTSLTGAVFVSSPGSELALIDCVLTDCDLSRVTVSTMRGCRLVGCKLAGTELSGRSLRDVSFERCALQYANLRMATLERVSFGQCKLDDVDFYEAELTDVTFTATAFTDVSVAKTRFERVDMRGVTAFGITDAGNLSGCLIADSQVQALAYSLALAAGASIERSD